MTYKIVKLGDIFQSITDGTHYTPKHQSEGIPFLTVKDMTAKGLDFTNCAFISKSDYEIAKNGNSAPQLGDVLYSKDGTVGKVYVVKENKEFAVLSSIAILKPNKKNVNSEFLGHILKSDDVLSQAIKSKTGSAIRRIILSDLKKVLIPLPPLDEQKRIAAVLDKADEVRSKRRQSIKKLDALLQSVFLDMFGDPVSNPKGWDERTIEELCFVKGGKRLPKGKDYSLIPTQFRYIRVTDLKKGMINENNLKFLTPEVQKTIKNYIVNDGDIIISIAGSIGLIAPVGKSLDGVNLTENAAKLVQKTKGTYNHIFMSYQLQLPSAQNQFFASVGQVTIGKLALFRIEKAKVLLPPKDLQNKFATSVSKIEKLKDKIQLSTEESDLLFQSLQQRAFAGDLFGAKELENVV